MSVGSLPNTTDPALAPGLEKPSKFSLLAALPGILLLFVVGYSGKFLERTIAAYGKAHHLVLPNIEYVLWAILIGLAISNTVGVPKIFRPGVATYEFWLKTGSFFWACASFSATFGNSAESACFA